MSQYKSFSLGNEPNNIALVISSDGFLILNAKNAALCLCKEVIAANKHINNITYVNCFDIWIEKEIKIILNNKVEKPTNWDEMVEEFYRILKLKSFI